jgi:hypothetical protein
MSTGTRLGDLNVQGVVSITEFNHVFKLERSPESKKWTVQVFKKIGADSSGNEQLSPSLGSVYGLSDQFRYFHICEHLATLEGIQKVTYALDDLIIYAIVVLENKIEVIRAGWNGITTSALLELNLDYTPRKIINRLQQPAARVYKLKNVMDQTNVNKIKKFFDPEKDTSTSKKCKGAFATVFRYIKKFELTYEVAKEVPSAKSKKPKTPKAKGAASSKDTSGSPDPKTEENRIPTPQERKEIAAGIKSKISNHTATSINRMFDKTEDEQGSENE